VPTRNFRVRNKKDAFEGLHRDLDLLEHRSL
jgi:hypothetical protein